MAPDGVGEFEAHGLRAIFLQRSWGAFLVDLVCGCGALQVWRDVAAHVEALYFGGVGGSSEPYLDRLCTIEISWLYCTVECWSCLVEEIWHVK